MPPYHRIGPDGETRFSLLEVIRDYAFERQREDHALEALQRRHALFFTALCESAHHHLYTRETSLWHDRLAEEQNNIRAAVAWAFAHNEPALVASIGLALQGSSWSAVSPFIEGFDWLERVLTVRDQLPAALVAQTLLVTGISIWNGFGCYADNAIRAKHSIHEGLVIFREVNDQRGIATGLLNLGMIFASENRFEHSNPLLTESIELLRLVQDAIGITEALGWLSYEASHHGDLDRAAALLDEAMALIRPTGYKPGLTMILLWRGDLAMKQGEYGQATIFHEERMAVEQELRNANGVAHSLGSLGLIALFENNLVRAQELFDSMYMLFKQRDSVEGALGGLLWLGYLSAYQGHIHEARTYFQECESLVSNLQDERLLVCILGGYSMLATIRGQLIRTTRLVSAADVLRDRGYSCLQLPDECFFHAQQITTLRAQLDETAFSEAWAGGQALTLEQAMAEALRYR